MQDTTQEEPIEKAAFSLNDAINDLWDKLDGWLDAIILKLPNFALAILVMVLFYFIARGVRKLVKRVLLRKVGQESVKQILGSTAFAVTLLIGFFVALGVMELDKALTTVLASAGVAGLAIGLALQGTLSNTVSGFMLSFMPKVNLGDFIETSDDSGFVTEINLRSVTILRSDKASTVIPNSNFINNPFTNYSLSERARLIVSCGVGYESDLQAVEDLTVRIIAETFEQQEGEKVELFFTEFGDSSINFVVRFWANTNNTRDLRSIKHRAIKT
ncbi:MAG: mechanosensitive ion channel family protein, partial [Marinirhabdus sp.]